MNINSTNNSNPASFGSLKMTKSSLKTLQEAKKDSKIGFIAKEIEDAYQSVKKLEKSDKKNSFTLLWGINHVLGTVNLTFSHAAKTSEKLFAKKELITSIDTVFDILPTKVETTISNYIKQKKL